MTEREIVRRPSAAHARLPADLHPVLRRVYAARGVLRAEELDNSLNRLLPYADLRGIDAAVGLLQQAIEQDQRILVVADFDADGATSCAVAVRGLRLLGAADVRFVVPNRFEYGYGLTPEIVEVAASHNPQLLITVDNGISSLEGVAAARKRGMKVLVTDHHLPGARLPNADAIVNPNQPGDEFASKNLAGVGVMFYVIMALRARLRDEGWFARRSLAEPNLAQLLDLVALGTVADVVPLDHNNRVLVAQGLARIRAGRAHAGVLALAEVAARTPSRLTAGDMGFALGPRLNAAGRLTDMSVGIACLLADDESAAFDLASRLDALNRERRDIEAQMQDEALAGLEREGRLEAGNLPSGLCLFEDTWHPGVVGILAARIKERTHRPVIAFAASGRDEIKGSARSVSGLHIRDVLDAVAARHPGLIAKFGGHAMAAGLSLHRRDFVAFAEAFDAEVARRLRPEDLRGVVHSDGELAPADLTLDLAQQLRDAGPWGQGFEEPVFDGCFDLLGSRVVGDRHLKMALRASEGRAPLEAIAFNAADALPAGTASVHLAYRLDVNEYLGERRLQLVVAHLEPS